jgi:hypothetical protein
MERRNCQEVILKMLDRIPDTETEFIKALKWNLEDASYKAPEETLQWHRTMETLMKYIPNPKEDWEFVVLSIWTTKSIEEVKEMVKNREK